MSEEAGENLGDVLDELGHIESFHVLAGLLPAAPSFTHSIDQDSKMFQPERKNFEEISVFAGRPA